MTVDHALKHVGEIASLRKAISNELDEAIIERVATRRLCRMSTFKPHNSVSSSRFECRLGATRMPAHRKVSGEAVSAFFAALEHGEPVSRACRAAGCSRQALYRRRVKDLAFDQRWREAETALLTKKAKEQPRSRKGFTLPIFSPRGRAGHKKTLSDGMLLGRLKALRPAYRD